jgi:hypothetical protein
MKGAMHCIEPCDLARAIADADSDMLREIHMRGTITPASPLLQRCPIGLTAKQAVLIAALSTRQGCITSHAEAAHLCGVLWGIETTKVAIRELTDKLRKRDFFSVCQAAHEGIIQGMAIVFSAKCCGFLQLPLAPPHTVALSPTHTPACASPHERTATPDAATAHSPASPSLLQKKKEDEEKNVPTFLKEKQATPALADEFFEQVAEDYTENWPHLMRVGFDFPAFVNAAHKAPDKGMLIKTWRQSLTYADFAWKTPALVKDSEGKSIRSPHTWIAGCFIKSSHYPRPLGYRTPEELAQEATKQAAQQEAEARCDAAYQKWRVSKTNAELLELMGYKYGSTPPEPIVRAFFKTSIWPEQPDAEAPQKGMWAHSTFSS